MDLTAATAQTYRLAWHNFFKTVLSQMDFSLGDLKQISNRLEIEEQIFTLMDFLEEEIHADVAPTEKEYNALLSWAYNQVISSAENLGISLPNHEPEMIPVKAIIAITVRTHKAIERYIMDCYNPTTQD